MQAHYVFCPGVLFEVTGGLLAPPCARKQQTRLSANKPPPWSIAFLKVDNPINQWFTKKRNEWSQQRLEPYGAKMHSHEPWGPQTSLALWALRVVMVL